VALIADRFSNPAIHDTTRRVAFDGSSRHAGFILPILRDALAARGPVDGLALVEALWARMCAGLREDGTEIEANDPNWPQLQQAAQAARTAPEVWLAQSEYYGDLAQETQFADRFCHWHALIWSKGTREALRSYTTQI
jgi:mannitol 2-dehydrogenase